jgi:hypothetical protein
MRFGRACAVLAALAALSACGTGFFRQYEYEEDVYLSLDGSATVYVNSSIAALDALRGASFDTDPAARFDRTPFREYFSSPGVHVTRVSSSRRSGRRFVHVRMEVDNIRTLGSAPPFAWSVYSFSREGAGYQYRQTVGASAARAVPNPPWTGREVVAFRLHLPSKITYDNASVSNHKRGNIVVWEQPLADRLRGVPLSIDARMETQSILNRTLWLFGVTFVAVAITFVGVIWWVLRRAPAAPAGAP